MEAYEVEHDFSGIGRRTMLLNAREVFHQNGAHKLILLAIEDVVDDDLGFAASLVVEHSELSGDLPRQKWIARQQQVKRLLRVVHPAGSVQPGGDLETDVRRVERPAVDAGGVTQCANAGSRLLAHQPQSFAHDVAIDSEHR